MTEDKDNDNGNGMGRWTLNSERAEHIHMT